jgi:FMN phosphatase YigB (HAD superfamily)
MTLTLLLDLDDTLLQNDMGTFIPAYLQALSKRLTEKVSPDHLVKHLMRATQIMIANDRPDRTLKEVFDQAFYPALGLEESQVHQEIEDFYQNHFTQLQGLTRQMPGAVELVKESLQRNYDLILATNPLFPLLANLHRLKWAGLGDVIPLFRIIASYETFHFAKPNPAFFTELLARDGWREQGVLMIGNDLEMDILPARKIGIQTFLVSPLSHPSVSVGGDLSRVIDWIDQTPTEEMMPDFSSPEAILAILKSTAAVLPMLCKKMPSDQWSTRFAQNEWCQTEILCHLRDVEVEVNLPRLRKAIETPNPFIAGVDTDPWAEQRNYRQQSGEHALREFLQARLELIHVLQELSPEIWSRKVRHAIFGPTSLQELSGIIASHDRIHIRQIVQNQQRSSKESARLD